MPAAASRVEVSVISQGDASVEVNEYVFVAAATASTVGEPAPEPESEEKAPRRNGDPLPGRGSACGALRLRRAIRSAGFV